MVPPFNFGELFVRAKRSVERTNVSLPAFIRVRKMGRNIPVAVIILALILGGGAVTYAASLGSRYFSVHRAIQSVSRFNVKGDFAGAVAALAAANTKSPLGLQDGEIKILLTKENEFVTESKTVANAEVLIGKKEYGDAKSELDGVKTDYPQYEEVRSDLDTIEQDVETNLKNVAASAQAQARAASAQAQVAAQEKAAEEAQAAAAQASAQAEAAQAQQQAQAAETARELQVEQSFLNELTSAYNSFVSNAEYYYNQGIDYSNEGESILAIADMGDASAVLNSAYNNIDDLSVRYTGLPTNYYSASQNMLSAINFLKTACNLTVSSEGTSLDYSVQINNDKNEALTYVGLVKDFLDAH